MSKRRPWARPAPAVVWELVGDARQLLREAAVERERAPGAAVLTRPSAARTHAAERCANAAVYTFAPCTKSERLEGESDEYVNRPGRHGVPGTGRGAARCGDHDGRSWTCRSVLAGEPAMLTATEIAGFVGAGLAGAAYVPQIAHLIRARCSAGISQLAFEVWLVASLLTTAHAIAIGASVFIVLGGIQIVATTLIMLCAARYKNTPCPIHLPRPPEARTATRTGSSGNEPGPWHPVAESAAPAGNGGAPRAGIPVMHLRSCTLTGQSGLEQARTDFHITH